MRLSDDVVEYFKAMALEAGVPYQSLINLYLRDCLAQSRKIQIQWPKAVELGAESEPAIRRVSP